jgi:hypothetical protein
MGEAEGPAPDFDAILKSNWTENIGTKFGHWGLIYRTILGMVSKDGGVRLPPIRSLVANLPTAGAP